jgi:hypothetical protein
MSSNTTRGSYHVTTEHNMRAYDSLPPALREIHRNCLYDYAAPPHVTDLRKGASVMALIDSLMHSDVSLARRDAKKDWRGQHEDYLAVQRPRRRRDWYDKPPRARL